MKVSYEWLKELVNIPDSPQKTADAITMAGLEVEKLVTTGIGDANVVVAEILDVQKHPDADRLLVTKVDCGTHGEKQIVTNVAGVQKGQKVLVALDGVKLANGLVIKQAKLKGVESQGMFVGWEELGVPQKSQDLFYLDESVVNGTNYNEIMPFNDTVIDIELTANRGDCLGMFGVARDVKALYNLDVNHLDISYNCNDKKVNDFFSVQIDTPNCLRYCGAVILDVEIKPSPYWMQLKLIKAGIRPINNIVDITNYVLLECNQPLHAFDMDKIKNSKLIVRDAKNNEKMTTLDDIERKLESNDIVIADQDVGHCLGGVMGGQISEVSDNTKNIFLEAAFFKPDVIRKTSKRTGLRSESSYRFERATDMENVDWALKRALYWFDQLKVGTICTGIIDIYPGKADKRKVTVTSSWVNNKLGTDLTQDAISKILEKLDFEVENNADNIDIKIPSWRNDVSIKEDIAEEVARIFGYNNIKHSHYPSYQSAMRTPVQKNHKIMRELLYRAGFDETVNYSFIGKSLLDKMLLSEKHSYRDIIYFDEPLTDDWAGMRNSLIPGMVRTAALNVNRGNKSIALFELGNISIVTKKEFPEEQRRACLVLGGNRRDKEHASTEEKYDFYDMKGAVEYILSYFQIDAKFVASNEPFLHPYQQAKLLINDKEAGILGKLHPMVADSFDIEIDLYIAEIFADLIFENISDKIVYQEIPRYPSSVRDLALLVDKKVSAEDILGTIESMNIDILQGSKVFDIYTGENIDNDKYSIAIALTFNKITATLTDTEVDAVINDILANLKKRCGAVIR